MKGLFFEFSDSRIDADTEFGDSGNKEKKEEGEGEMEEGGVDGDVTSKGGADGDVTSTTRLLPVEYDEAAVGSGPPSSVI